MNTVPSVSAVAAATARPTTRRKTLQLCGFGLGLAACAALLHASEGCQLLLCLSSSNWRSIPLCEPLVRKVMRDLARSRPLPVCTMSGPGNGAQHDWASAPMYCPPQYSRVVDGYSAPTYLCDYTGAITVTINGAVFTRTWWSLDGDSVTDFSPVAKAQLGTWDTRFDDDYARWLASLPPSPPDQP